MIFDEFDFEFLRLCGLCRYVPTGLRRKFNSPYFSPPVIYTLRNNGYVKMQSDKKSYKLTFAGKQVLADMGYTFPEDNRTDIKKVAYQRKIKSALFNITLHLAGIDIFADNTALLSNDETRYVTSLMLRSDNNVRVLASTRFLGILKMFNTAYIPYYPDKKNYWVMPKHETEIFKAQVNSIKGVNNIQLIVTGDTLEEIWGSINPSEKSEICEKGMRRIDEALEEFGFDYSLIPVSGDGVMQLSVMKIWGYREIIAKAIGCDTTRVFNLSECDGFVGNVPYIIAIDFNVKRILRAIEQIERYNDTLVPKICGLSFQMKTISKLIKRYNKKCTMGFIDVKSVGGIISEHCNNITKNQIPYTKEGGTYISANQRKITKIDIKEL